MNFTRDIKTVLKSDLNDRKMVLIGGPRQVGKTTLAKSFLKDVTKQYFSWDDINDRLLIRKHQIDPTLKIVVLDEIHKYAKWRTLLKGLYDKYADELLVLVTGSARLDHFRKGGDSLFGRYHYHRLHPFSLPEIDKSYSPETTLRLLKYSGFPEPYVKQSERFLRRWNRERISRVVNQDVRDLDSVKELSAMELLVDLLPAKVGSLLSIKSLQEDLEVSPNTVAHWIRLLELVYYCYRIIPYGTSKIRAVKKANKLYLWNWSEVEEAGPRFENFVASHLLKYCHHLEDTEGYKMELRYLRDIDYREVDFVVLKNNKPLFAVECKTGEKNISPHLKYFRDRTDIPKFYQVHLGTKKYIDKNIMVLPFQDFCKIERLP